MAWPSHRESQQLHFKLTKKTGGSQECWWWGDTVLNHNVLNYVKANQCCLQWGVYPEYHGISLQLWQLSCSLSLSLFRTPFSFRSCQSDLCVDTIGADVCEWVCSTASCVARVQETRWCGCDVAVLNWLRVPWHFRTSCITIPDGRFGHTRCSATRLFLHNHLINPIQNLEKSEVSG